MRASGGNLSRACGRATAALAVLLSVLLLAACAEDLEQARQDPGLFAKLRDADLSAPRRPAGEVAPERAVEAAEAPAPPPQKQLFLGSDRYLKRQPPPVAEARALDGGVQLNFDNADLREFTRLILGDILGLTFTYDSRVQGSVTLASSEPIGQQHLLATLETVLRMNNAALLLDEGIYRVVPVGETIGQPSVRQLGTSQQPLPSAFGLTVVPLRNVAAANMVQVLDSVVSRPGAVRADPARNLLVISGTSAERASLADTVASFDVDWLAGQSAGIFPLRHSTPETVIAELEALLQSAPEGLAAGLIRFMPIERLNAVLAISKRADLLRQAELWVGRLDRKSDAGVNLYVYYVQNGKAADLAEILNEAFGGAGGARRDTGRAVSPSLDPVVVGGAGGGAEGGAAGARPVPAGVGGRAGLRGTPLSLAEIGEIRVIADEVNNALLILASRQGYDLVRSALRQVDVPPLQVLIDATIAEVTLNDQLRFGVQYFLEDIGLGIGNLNSDIGFAQTLPLAGTFPGFNFIVNSGGEARFVIDALSSVTDVKVVSSPSLVVLDNQSAQLQVGDEVPVSTRQSSSVTDPNAPIVNTIEFRDTGVILEVTPRINASGLVTLEIEQEVSNVAPSAAEGEGGGLTPTISQRRISSKVAVNSGQTVALGGLISERQTNAESGIPGLRELPLLGPLFGTTNLTNNRTELIVFIRPQVIRNGDDAQLVAEELRARLRSLAPAAPETRME